MRLLIVEDNTPMRLLMKHMLADLADEITECADGLEVLAVYRRLQPDWVLMDIELKEMDGITAIAQLKAAFPEARVITVTNYDHPKLREAARQAGAGSYILKDNLLALREFLLAHR
jgi:two-component system response regulator DesR